MRRILLLITIISLLISNIGISGVLITSAETLEELLSGFDTTSTTPTTDSTPGTNPVPVPVPASDPVPVPVPTIVVPETKLPTSEELAKSTMVTIPSASENSTTNNAAPASDPSTTTTTTTSNSTTSSTSSKITVITTEEIPGANCTCIADGASRTEDVNGNTLSQGSGEAACNNITTRKYSCEVTSGMTAFQGIMGTLIKWFIYIIMLLGVLAIVGAGIMMTFGSDSEEYTKKAKGWAMNIVIGLVILFTFSYILKLLAPWIYQ